MRKFTFKWHKYMAMVLLLMVPVTTFADETAELWQDNIGGLNVLITAEIPTAIQNVSYTSAGSQLITINLPGATTSGFVFTISWDNATAEADTLWKYYPTYAAAADSSYFMLKPGQGIVRLLVKEGDKLRLGKVATGSTLLYLGGAKRFRNADF